MKRIQTAILFLSLLVGVAILAEPIAAQTRNLVAKGDFSQKRGYFLIRFGFVSGEIVRLDGLAIDGQPGATFGAGLDFRTTRHLLLGVSADVHRIHVVDSGQYFFDLSLTAKAPIYAKNARIGFRPGVALGFGVMDYFVGVERTTYLVWKVTLETVFFGPYQNAWFFDIGLMGTSFGGNSEHTMRFGPFPYIRGGVMF